MGAGDERYVLGVVLPGAYAVEIPQQGQGEVLEVVLELAPVQGLVLVQVYELVPQLELIQVKSQLKLAKRVLPVREAPPISS